MPKSKLKLKLKTYPRSGSFPTYLPYIFAVLIYVRDLIRRNSQGAKGAVERFAAFGHIQFLVWPMPDNVDDDVAQTGSAATASLRLWAKRFWLQSDCFLLLTVVVVVVLLLL